MAGVPCPGGSLGTSSIPHGTLKPMTTRTVKNLVLGAGAMGSAAAYHLARRGEPVVLVEQFALGHDRGSSHGSARITRHSYADPVYARLMLDAFRAWRELEADAGQPLYIRTGGVSICPESADYVGRVAGSLASIDVPHRRMTGREWNRGFAGLRAGRDGRRGLRARRRDAPGRNGRSPSRWTWPGDRGGESTEVLEGVPVRRIDLDGDRPTLILDDQQIAADRLIVTAGAWTGRLLPALAVPLRPTRQQVLYFRPVDPERFAIGRFPVFIYKGATEHGRLLRDARVPGAGREGGPARRPRVRPRPGRPDDRGRVYRRGPRCSSSRTIPDAGHGARSTGRRSASTR